MACVRRVFVGVVLRGIGCSRTTVFMTCLFTHMLESGDFVGHVFYKRAEK